MGRAKVIPPKAKLLPYQRAWVLDTSRLKLAVKGRQIGWTWASGYGLVRRKGVKGATLDAWISSRDEEQARLFLEDCKAFGHMLDVGTTDLGEKLLDDKGSSSFTLQLANGIRIHSMSSNPDAQAGKRGDRVLDEFALHPDPRKLYAIAYPGITWGGSMEIFSTPRGSDNFFQKLIGEIEDGNPKKFSYHKVTLEDALAQGFLAKLQEKLPPGDERQEMDEQEYFDFIRDGAPDEETFNQEYMCVPSDDATAFFPYADIDRCTVPGAGTTGCKEAKKTWTLTWRSAEPIGGGDLFGGYDIGRRKDLSAFWLGEKDAGVVKTRVVVVMNRVKFSKQYDTIDEWCSLPNFRRLALDMTGMGEKPYEDMVDKYGYKAEGVRFGSATKEAMAMQCKKALEDAAWLIPGERYVVADFRKIKKLTTAGDNVRFDASRDADGHSDRFWGGALMYDAASSGGAYVKPFFCGRRNSPDTRSID